MSWIRLFVGRFSGDNHWPHLSDYRGRVDFDKSEAATVRPEGRCQNQRIACVILGTCQRKAVAKAVNLLRIDGKYGKAVVEESFDESTHEVSIAIATISGSHAVIRIRRS